MVRPTNCSHVLLNHVQSLSIPDIQIRTGRWSAVGRNRSAASQLASELCSTGATSTDAFPSNRHLPAAHVLYTSTSNRNFRHYFKAVGHREAPLTRKRARTKVPLEVLSTSSSLQRSRIIGSPRPRCSDGDVFPEPVVGNGQLDRIRISPQAYTAANRARDCARVRPH